MPDIPSLTAVGTSRVIDLQTLPCPAVLICFAQATQGGADDVELAVRERYSVAQVLVGHVIDLRDVSRLFRGVAEGILRGEYKKAVDGLSDGQAPGDHVIILPDWDGAFVRAVGLNEVGKNLGVAVFHQDGTLAGTDQGGDVPAATLRLLESVVA